MDNTAERLGLRPAVNAGPRLDRLPISSFHKRLFALVGFGMFFDGFDIYIAATVLGATLRSGFSTLGQNAAFVSSTFLGMMIGSLLTGFIGDRYGRRVTYQLNLLLFGGASLLSAFAPSMEVLIVLRFLMGVGLGAENVVGYSTMTEFVPASVRGPLAGLRGGAGGDRPAGVGAGRLAAGAVFRLAGDVRAGWGGRTADLAGAQVVAGEPALAGERRPGR